VAAIIELRRRTQAAEARVRELEGGKDKAAKPSVLDDEDKAFDTRIDEGTRGLREQNYHLSVKLARMEHRDDFATAEEAFANAAEQDDRLIAGLRASADPGEYIYTVGLQIKELAEVGGDFVKYREKVTGEARTKISDLETRNKALEAQVAELTKQKTDLETLPRSLNSRPSGSAPVSGSEDPEDIKSLTRFGKSNTR
jgi:septal ring factor EnvC (AmiA/AmiB activator)